MSVAAGTPNAADIIEQIKKLPPDQVQVVRAFIENGGQKAEPESAVKYITREEVEKSAEEIFGKYSDLFKRLAQ